MDTRNFIIGILSVTATILFVGLVLVSTLTSSPALAFGQNDRGGDYVVATGQLDRAVELLYVLDAAVPSLAIYRFDPNRGGLILDDAQNLGRLINRGPTDRDAATRPPP